MEEHELTLSTLPKTWIFDLDGTLVKHNGYLIDGYDTLLPGAAEFLSKIPDEDIIIIMTARKSQYQIDTELFLNQNQIRYDNIIFDTPVGERILINDKKNSGMRTAYAINVNRNSMPSIVLKYDLNL